MQYGLIKLIGATVLASTAATVACANYSGSNTSFTSGGSSSVGGSGTDSLGGGSSTGTKATGGSGPATGGAASCPSTTLCGSGDVTGTWTVSSSCLTLSGELDTTGLGCATAPISGGQLTVTGKWSADAALLYTDNTNTKGTVYFTLAPACLSISNSPPSSCSQISQSLPGFTKDSTCITNASSGCDCTGIVDNQGSMGVLVPSGNPGTYDAYSTDGNLLTLWNNHDQMPYSYCVSGDTLTVIPQPTHPTIAGTITLQKQP